MTVNNSNSSWYSIDRYANYNNVEARSGMAQGREGENKEMEKDVSFNSLILRASSSNMNVVVTNLRGTIPNSLHLPVARNKNTLGVDITI